jgi:hypothetical protein
MVGDIGLIWVRSEAENFLRDDWTGGIALKWKENFRFWRRGFLPSLPATNAKRLRKGARATKQSILSAQ